jgi:biotin operon repressor
MSVKITDKIEDSQRRAAVKQASTQLKNLVTAGCGISPWEADSLVKVVEDVFLDNPVLKAIQPGQMPFLCVSAKEGAGKPLKSCQMVQVLLTVLHEEDGKELGTASAKNHQVHMRQRRLQRLACEARDQGGLLSQEDLAQLLQCDVKSIQRDVKDLQKVGLVVPTRGTVQDIGPGVTHRELVVRCYVEKSMEAPDIARATRHSLKAVDNYLSKYGQVCFLREKGFTDLEISVTTGISLYGVKSFNDLYQALKGSEGFKRRRAELFNQGETYYASAEKKSSSPANA